MKGTLNFSLDFFLNSSVFNRKGKHAAAEALTKKKLKKSKKKKTKLNLLALCLCLCVHVSDTESYQSATHNIS